MTMHFMTFKNECACNKSLKNVAKSNTWKFVTCKRCKKNDEYKQFKQLWKEENDHSVFRQALKDKVDLYIFSNDKKDIIRFQEIAFELGVFWINKEKLKHTDSHTIGASGTLEHYRLFYNIDTQDTTDKQLSFKDDCFVEDIENKLISEFNKLPKKEKQKLAGQGKQIVKKALNDFKQQPKSACGRNLEEFINCVDYNGKNAECKATGTWKTTNYNKNGLYKNIKENYAILKNYRIKEPNNVEVINKPPLGLKPLYIHNENRVNEIKEAFTRYIEVKKDIPSEWVSEYLELINKIIGV